MTLERINSNATLVFKKVVTNSNLYTVTGDLTIKGITKPVTFDLVTQQHTAVDVVIDKYDIKYGSGSFFDSLVNKAINTVISL
jgi:polyisoprenoid-binding protein YceI